MSPAGLAKVAQNNVASRILLGCLPGWKGLKSSKMTKPFQKNSHRNGFSLIIFLDLKQTQHKKCSLHTKFCHRGQKWLLAMMEHKEPVTLPQSSQSPSHIFGEEIQTQN